MRAIVSKCSLTAVFDFCRCLLAQMEVKEFIKQCMMAAGTKAGHASSLADVLVEGDLRGHYSHGLNRMGVYENHGPINYHLVMPFLFYFNLH